MTDQPVTVAPKRKRVSACVSCYQAKTKCSGEIPCERCVKLGRKCEPQLRGPGRPSKESRARYERAGVDAFIKFARTDLKHNTARTHDPIRSLACCAAFLHQLESGGDQETSTTTAPGRAAVALANALNCSPRSLMEDAVNSLWADPSTLFEHTDSWMPTILARLSFSEDPVLTRTFVLGKLKQQTNLAWDSLFCSPVEVSTLAGGQHKKMPPLLGVPVSSEIPRLMTHLLQGIFQSVSKPDERGRLIQYCDVSYVCPCVDRYSRCFMGLVRIRQCFLSRGAVVAQTVTITWLPESQYVYDLRLAQPQWSGNQPHPATVILQASNEQQQQEAESQDAGTQPEDPQVPPTTDGATNAAPKTEDTSGAQVASENPKEEPSVPKQGVQQDVPVAAPPTQQMMQMAQQPMLPDGLQEYRAVVESHYQELIDVLL